MMTEKEAILQDVYRKGFEFEKNYRGCAQCIVAAVQEHFEVDDLVFKSASAFSGGVAASVEGHCGAFSGGIMLLNYFFGRDKQDFASYEATEKAKVLALRFKDRFVAEYGGIMCAQVQTKIMGRAYVLADPGQKELFEAAGGHVDKCPAVVGKAAALVAEILLDQGVPLKK